MAIMEVPGGFFFPPQIQFDSASIPDITDLTLDTTIRKIAFILRAPKSGNVERFEFAFHSSPAPIITNEIKVSFQDVSSGEPDDGTTYYYDIPSAYFDSNFSDWAIPLSITDDGMGTGNLKAVTRGDFLACVIEWDAFNIGDSLVLKKIGQDSYAPKGGYMLTADSGDAWTKISGIPTLALVYEGDDFVPLVDAYAVYDISPVAFDENTGRDEYGLAITLTAPVRAGGAYVLIDPDENFTVTLYDAEANSILETVNVNIGEYYPNSNNTDYVYVRFNTDRLLHPNQIYILSVKPNGSGQITVYIANLYDGDRMASLPGGSVWRNYVRADSGDWTEFAEERPIFGLHITGTDHEIGGNPTSGWEGNP